jgi:hypothetical protein
MSSNTSVRAQDDLSSKMADTFISKGDSCECGSRRRCKCKDEKKCKNICIELSDSEDYDSDCQPRHRKDCKQKKCNCQGNHKKNCQRQECDCGKKKKHCQPKCVPSCPPPCPPKPPSQLQSGEIPFSASLFGKGVSDFTSTSPIVMSYGNIAYFPSTSTDVILPSGLSWVVPFDGIIKDLAVGADIHISPEPEDNPPYLINSLGYQVDFTIMISPSSPNNGVAHPSVPYAPSTLTSSVRFGFPNTTTVPLDSYWTGTNLNPGMNIVHAGDRVTLRAQTNASTDPTLVDLTEIQLSGSVYYQRNPPVTC